MSPAGNSKTPILTPPPPFSLPLTPLPAPHLPLIHTLSLLPRPFFVNIGVTPLHPLRSVSVVSLYLNGTRSSALVRALMQIIVLARHPSVGCCSVRAPVLRLASCLLMNNHLLSIIQNFQVCGGLVLYVKFSNSGFGDDSDESTVTFMGCKFSHYCEPCHFYPILLLSYCGRGVRVIVNMVLNVHRNHKAY